MCYIRACKCLLLNIVLFCFLLWCPPTPHNTVLKHVVFSVWSLSYKLVLHECCCFICDLLMLTAVHVYIRDIDACLWDRVCKQYMQHAVVSFLIWQTELRTYLLLTKQNLTQFLPVSTVSWFNWSLLNYNCQCFSCSQRAKEWNRLFKLHSLSLDTQCEIHNSLNK